MPRTYLQPKTNQTNTQLVAFSKLPCTHGPFLSPARTCISISVFEQPEGEGWNRGSLMIDSLAGPPGGLWAGCQPFPEVWGQGRDPTGLQPHRASLGGGKAEHNLQVPSTLLPSVKGKSGSLGALPSAGPPLLPLALLPFWWVKPCTVLLTDTSASTAAHPTHTAHGLTGPFLSHSSPVHYPVVHRAVRKTHVANFGKGIKGMGFSSKISEEL